MAITTDGTTRSEAQADVPMKIQPRLPILSRLANGTVINAMQIFGAPVVWAEDWYRWVYPSDFAPDIVKTYKCRKALPIRIFFPKSYDRTSSHTLPTFFSIHGGGFSLGRAHDDDEWNARFATMHNILVIALNYRKALAYPFPTATYDIEALILAAYDDKSLPIDQSRIAIGGFSAGGNLTLSVCQLPSIREEVKPSAVLPVYAVVDFTVPVERKVKMRYYKPELGLGLRAQSADLLAQFAHVLNWSYVNPGHSLEDPLLSPIYARREDLPPHLFFVASELDQLAHESWRMASRLAGRPIPGFADRAGQQKTHPEESGFILDDERFAFEHLDTDGKGEVEGSVRWLLIPDQIHGFDRLPERWQGKEAVEDAKLKTVAYQKITGEWLRNVAWKR
ncbi:alpha/beta-hydrolase [Xylariaceae sp. FL0662B]|nr:alpha/beta-hydrolase [Xylariaceae sp. FL0662B]